MEPARPTSHDVPAQASPPPVILTRALLAKAGVRVKQSIPGRMRVRVNGLRFREREAGWMRRHLGETTGVIAVESRPATGSVIILFQPEGTTVRALLTAIVRQVLQPRMYQEVPEPLPGFRQLCSDCDDHGQSGFSSRVRRVVWLSGCMLYAAARLWLFRLPLIQTPLSFLGLAALLGALPLAREAARDCADNKVTVKPFLAAGSLITIAMGQAFSALQILWIYNVAELTEHYVARRSRQAIRDILEVAPANAFVMIDGMEVETPVADIRPGDIVAVHTGERIPVDGEVAEGEALVDESSINGRAEALARGRGDTVFAGTILSQGVLFIRTTRTGEDTYLARIMRMVEDSLANKAPVEQKADQLAARLMKIGLAATALTLLITLDPLRALTVMLVMSCPCATVLAASSAVTASLANAARHSILIKGGLYLETVGRADIYCFDKTGTLTMEQPEVVAISGRTPAISENAILAMAATAESHNQHPMAKAILAMARERHLSPEAHAVCDFKAGRGVLCTVGGDAVILVGNRAFMDEHGVDVRWFDKKATAQRAMGNTVVYVARNGGAQGMLGIANPVRPEAVRVLNCLRGDGVRSLHLVTGDSEEVARGLMDIFPFDECRAGLMPEEKARRVDELKQGHSVVMVGDGVNDALALAQADIGIAMGAAGAEVAMEAADIALADSDLEGLMKVRNLSRQTMRVIDQNHYLAVSTDLIGAALAMAGLLSPIMAGMIHILHTGGILLNSGRLLTWEPPVEPMLLCSGCPRNCRCGNNDFCRSTKKTC
ncbi:heavy metal translocating P-type ATPase [Desulfobulbus alkaliphilus]|uniref:heavy metal translocating P-type ATPase n=1 Tax=Desulfobulbus alkaliphilus TaxID=869814 RepID=UPI0019664DA1|nr:cation-translocating P-type ATPase [Desulfobulbus alkaliphilus]MBM9538703.1 cation-translocating P-type ATPase [Desulfobulbus alkaliphilus]